MSNITHHRARPFRSTVSEAADLISALTSVGALAASIAAAFIARRLFFIERDRDARRESEDRRRQASGVSAWIGVHVEPGKAKPPKVVVVSNTSDGPVFDVSVGTAKLDGITTRTPLLKCLPPGTFVYGRAADYKAHPKDSEWTYALTTTEFVGPPRPYSFAPGNAAVTDVTFSDALNQRWTRQSNGALISVIDEELPRFAAALKRLPGSHRASAKVYGQPLAVLFREPIEPGQSDALSVRHRRIPSPRRLSPQEEAQDLSQMVASLRTTLVRSHPAK
jgi:hypothetical protein